MSDQIEGAARQGLGHVQDGIGGLTGDSAIQAKGKLNEAAGSLQSAYGEVKDQARKVFGQAKDTAQDQVGQLDSYLRDKPLVGLGIGAGLGLLLGLAMSGGRRTVYIRRH